MQQSESELIGQGALWKMVRAALTDPDREIWRYSVCCRAASRLANGGFSRKLPFKARLANDAFWSKAA
jgi:hypothetical protein